MSHFFFKCSAVLAAATFSDPSLAETSARIDSLFVRANDLILALRADSGSSSSTFPEVTVPASLDESNVSNIAVLPQHIVPQGPALACELKFSAMKVLTERQQQQVDAYGSELQKLQTRYRALSAEYPIGTTHSCSSELTASLDELSTSLAQMDFATVQKASETLRVCSAVKERELSARKVKLDANPEADLAALNTITGQMKQRTDLDHRAVEIAKRVERFSKKRDNLLEGASRIKSGVCRDDDF